MVEAVAATVPAKSLADLRRPIESYENRTRLTTTLLARVRRAIVTHCGHAPASFTLVALLVGCTLRLPRSSCFSDVEAGAAQRVPCLLLLHRF